MPSNLERKARRTRQTRLTFDPVDRTSSPAAMSPARVRYEGARDCRLSPVSSRATADARREMSASPMTYKVLSRSSPLKGLPTPTKSSQVLEGGSHSAARSNNVEVVIHSSPTRSQPESLLHRSTRPSPADNQLKDLSSDTESDDVTPSKRHRQTKPSCFDSLSNNGKMFAKSKRRPKSSPTVPHLGNKSRSASSTAANTSILDDSDSDVDIPSSKPRSGMFGNSSQLQSIGRRRKMAILIESESEDGDEIVSSPKRSQRPQYENFTAGPEEGSDEDVQASPLKRRRLNTQVDDSDDDVLPPPNKRHTSLIQSDSDEPRIEDEDEDGKVVPYTTQRRSRNRKTSESTSQSERASPKRYTRQQKRRRHRTEKEKMLELLKRRRSGEVIDKLTSSDSDASESDEGEDFQELSEFDDDEEQDELPPVRQRINKKHGLDGEDAANDSDFIVEDDEALLGVPDYALAMPLEFTRASHKPLKEHFRDVVEWMVKNKIYPAFPRDDEMYKQAFRKLDDESYGLAKSKFSSTQWTKDFTTALYARPHISFGPLADGEGFDPASGRPKCDACNHRSHIPSFAIQFEGKAYDKKTLVDLDQDGDDSDEDGSDTDEDGSDAKSANSNGQLIPREFTRWFCGRFCKANAEFAHTLLHWKYSLNEWVVDTLEREGYLTPAKLAERDKMKAKQLNKFADRLVDGWEASGVIKDLFRDYKNQLTAAAELKSHGRGGWK